MKIWADFKKQKFQFYDNRENPKKYGEGASPWIIWNELGFTKINKEGMIVGLAEVDLMGNRYIWKNTSKNDTWMVE